MGTIYPYAPNTILVYLRKVSNSNVTQILQMPDTYGYRIQCNKCLATFDWAHDNFDKPLGIDFDILEKFCQDHKHLPDITKYDAGKCYDAGGKFVSDTPEYFACPENGQMMLEHIINTGLDPTNQNDYKLAYDEIKYKLKSNPNSGIPAGVSYNYKYTTTPPPSAYTTYITNVNVPEKLEYKLNESLKGTVLEGAQVSIGMGGYPASSVQLDQMQMKKIWQWSGFKVDMQVKATGGLVSQVRLFCNECKQFQTLEWVQVRDTNNPVWAGIEEWCKDHGCSEGTERPKGRKFKNA